MVEFLKRFRRKKLVAKPVALAPVKSEPPSMPVTRPARTAYQSPRVERTSVRHEVRASIAYESEPDPIYFPTPLYVPMDIAPTVEVYSPPAVDCSPVYSDPDPAPSVDCSPSIDYGSSTADW